MAIKSIGIIPDGTRRWAKRENISLFNAYCYTSDKLYHQIELLLGKGVDNIHVYMFSIYNLKRDLEEVVCCLDAEHHFISKLINAKKNIQVYGDSSAISLVHQGISDLIDSIGTIEPDKPIINLYIGYSFEHYLKSLILDNDTIYSFVDRLMSENIDIMIRTGGATTLSDFLPIQLRYSQLYFLPVLFNDFSDSDLISLCDSYENNIHQLKYGE